MTLHQFYLRSAFSAAIMITLLLSGTARATTWDPVTKKDPIAGGDCHAMEIMSYGGYIYNWPSKYDLVFWPYTDPSFVAYCPDSGYAAFNGDFGELSDEEKKRLAVWLEKNFDKTAKPGQDLRSLDWLEKLYSQRDMDDDFWSHFHRLRAYYAFEKNDKAAGSEHVIKALQLVQKKLEAGPKDFDLLETLYLLGEYNRRLGNRELAKSYFIRARTAEYTDEDGGRKTGHPYFLGLIADSEEVLDAPHVRPGQLKEGRGAPKSGHGVSSCASRIKSTLANLAIAQEAYWTENNKYADRLELLGPDGGVDEDITVKIARVGKDEFVLEAVRKNCDEDKDGAPDVYIWDSGNGGLQERAKP